jgi:hypothetical protein
MPHDCASATLHTSHPCYIVRAHGPFSILSNSCILHTQDQPAISCHLMLLPAATGVPPPKKNTAFSQQSRAQPAVTAAREPEKFL